MSDNRLSSMFIFLFKLQSVTDTVFEVLHDIHIEHCPSFLVDYELAPKCSVFWPKCHALYLYLSTYLSLSSHCICHHICFSYLSHGGRAHRCSMARIPVALSPGNHALDARSPTSGTNPTSSSSSSSFNALLISPILPLITSSPLLLLPLEFAALISLKFSPSAATSFPICRHCPRVMSLHLHSPSSPAILQSAPVMRT